MIYTNRSFRHCKLLLQNIYRLLFIYSNNIQIRASLRDHIRQPPAEHRDGGGVNLKLHPQTGLCPPLGNLPTRSFKKRHQRASTGVGDRPAPVPCRARDKQGPLHDYCRWEMTPVEKRREELKSLAKSTLHVLRGRSARPLSTCRARVTVWAWPLVAPPPAWRWAEVGARRPGGGCGGEAPPSGPLRPSCGGGEGERSRVSSLTCGSGCSSLRGRSSSCRGCSHLSRRVPLSPTSALQPIRRRRRPPGQSGGRHHPRPSGDSAPLAPRSIGRRARPSVCRPRDQNGGRAESAAEAPNEKSQRVLRRPANQQGVSSFLGGARLMSKAGKKS